MALRSLQALPKEARWKLSNAILQLQRGATLSMPLARNMPSVAPGVSEIRVRDAQGIYRAFYMMHTEQGVVVFHVFGKKTQKTPLAEIRLGQKRLKEMIDG